MAGSIYLDATNYSSAVNGRYYSSGNGVCNYPIIESWRTDNVQVSFTNSSREIELISSSSGDASFMDLYGNNTDISTIIKYPFLIDSNGGISKVEQILSSTKAMLSSPYYALTNTYTTNIVDIFGQPSILDTVIGNPTDSAMSGIIFTTEYDYTNNLSLAPSQSLSLGSGIVFVDFNGGSPFMIITF